VFVHMGDFLFLFLLCVAGGPHTPLDSLVEQASVRCPHDAITGTAKSDAEIDISEARREIAFVEAANEFKRSAANRHASSADA